MTVYRFDADMNGTDSIQHYIDSGKVVNLECPTFADFDRYRVELQKSIQPGDWIILDAISTMLATTRMDRTLGNKVDEALWEPSKVNRFFGDKEYLAVYNMAGNLTMRALKNLRARGAKIICLAHEDEVIDPMAQMKMAGPQVNPAMVGELIAASSDVFRLRALTDDVTNNEGKVVFPRDTRVLYLRRSDEYTAKFHVDRERSASIPKALPNPTLPKLWSVLGKQSSWVTIYGHPGAGKTTLGASVADDAEQIHQPEPLHHTTTEESTVTA